MKGLVPVAIYAGALCALVGGFVVFRNDIPTPGARPTVSPEQAALRRAQDAASLVQLKMFSWKQGFDLATADFGFDNQNDFEVYDLQVSCEFLGPSGTALNTHNAAIYDRIPANAFQTFKGVKIGLVHSQVSRATCRLTDVKIR
jgi:hypothetical protein